MPGTVYTVASGKGGVGKTTTTVNLGVAIWQEGNSVAIVDADLGMANLAAVLGLEPEVTLHDVLAGETILEEALVEAKGGDLLVLPGSRELEGFAAANPQKLKDVLENLRARCDYVIVDTGAGLGYEDVLPLGLADAVILVSSADPASLGDTRKTAELAELVETPVLGVVVTRAVEGTDAEAIAAEIGADLLGTIPEDPAVMEATVAGDPLASHAPESAATAAYMALGGRVLEAEVPADESAASDAAVPFADESSTGSVPSEDDEPPAEEDSAAGADDLPGDEPASAGGSADAAGTDEPAEPDDVSSGEDGPDAAESVGSEGATAAETAEEPGDEEAEEPDAAGDDVPDAGDADVEDANAHDADAADEPDDEDAPGADEPDAAADAAPAEDSDDAEGADAPTDEADVDTADDEAKAARVENDDAEGSGGIRGWLGGLFS